MGLGGGALPINGRINAKARGSPDWKAIKRCKCLSFQPWKALGFAFQMYFLPHPSTVLHLQTCRVLSCLAELGLGEQGYRNKNLILT